MSETSSILSPADRARYARQIRLDGFGLEAQAALLDAHVFVIGAGGLGAPILTYLAAAGVGRISVIDPDVIELSNLHRQFLHSEANVGQRKVDSAEARMTALNSSIEIITHPRLLTAENVLDLFADVDIVVDGSDNFETRYLANDACEVLGLPLVWGTILGFDGQLAVFDTTRGTTLRDLYPVVPEPGSVPDCATAGVIGALCGSIGSAMAMETIKVLTGIGTPLYNSVVVHSSLDARWETIPVARIPDRAAVTDLSAHLGGGAPVESDPEPAPSHSLGWADIDAATRLIDIREDAEVSAGMVSGAEHIPMDVLLADPTVLAATPGPIALYCRSGVRSARTVAQLTTQGIEAYSVDGGYLAYLSD